MADNNVIIELPGGAAGAYIEDLGFTFDHTTHTYHLIATHKDGTITNIDLGPLSIDLQVVGGVLLGNGDYQLTVVDPGGSGDVHLIIPLGNYYTKPDMDLLLDDKVDKIPGMGLSTEDFTTALLDKLENLQDTMVSAIDYDPISEIVTVTSAGPGGITQVDIDVLADKVDKIPGMGLSTNDFTNALQAQLALFDPTSIASIAFNAVTNQVLVTDHTGNQTVGFTLPTQIQSDWNVSDTSSPAFIVGKPFIQNQLDSNAAAIATNLQSIIDNEAANGTAHAAMNVEIANAAALITTNHAHVLVQDAEIHANQTDIQQNTTDVSTLNINTNANTLNIAGNAQDITALEQADGIHDGRLDNLEICCADQVNTDGLVATAISNLQGENQTQQTAIAANLSGITQTDFNLATLDGVVQANTSNISMNSANIVTLDGQNTAQQIQIDDLNTFIPMTPNQMSVFLQSAVNTNILSDVDWDKLQNLNANQQATDAAQNQALASFMNDQGLVDTAQDQALIDSEANQAITDAAQDQALLDAMTQANADFVNVTGDTMTGRLTTPNITINNNAAGDTDAVRAQSYASATLGGTVKVRFNAGTSELFITTNGSNP